MNHRDFLAQLDEKRITDAISAAETRTSGEIRVHVQPKATGGELRAVAERTFERLGMTKTALRNGVLLFICSEERRFVILGDSGIDAKVPEGFWDAIATNLGIAFRESRFTDGIVQAISASGEQLASYFPRATDDVDELSNDISVSD